MAASRRRGRGDTKDRPSELLACTAITDSCIGWARRLARSLAHVHPRAHLLVLVLDDVRGAGDYESEPFEVIHPDALGLKRYEILAAILGRRDLERVVCPALLRFAFARSYDLPVVYLDAQTELFADLAGFLARAMASGFALVPRLREPIPADGLRPTDLDVAAAGIMNSGIIACRPGERTAQLLHTWSDRLSHTHLRQHPEATRRWHDLITVFAPGSVHADDCGLGVGVWNLHERRLDRSSGRIEVNGSPLRTLSFQGLEPETEMAGIDNEDPGVLTRARALLEGQPVLAELVSERRAASGERTGYGFETLADGSRLTARLRRLIAAAELEGALTRSPFTAAGVTELMGWLDAQVGGAIPGLSRFWLEVYRSRADLRLAYPDLHGSDGPGYIGWIQRFGVGELPNAWEWATEVTIAANATAQQSPA